MRTPDDIDRELALLAAVRAAIGGSMTASDQLLDERNELRTAAGPLSTEQSGPSAGP